MECVVTETDYAEYGRGLVSDEMLASTLIYATQVVGEIIGNNEPDSYDDMQAYIKAVCAAADVDASYGYTRGEMEGINSVTVGAFSASFSSSATGGAASAYDHDMIAAVRRELASTGLMYTGVR